MKRPLRTAVAEFLGAGCAGHSGPAAAIFADATASREPTGTAPASCRPEYSATAGIGAKPSVWPDVSWSSIAAGRVPCLRWLSSPAGRSAPCTGAVRWQQTRADLLHAIRSRDSQSGRHGVHRRRLSHRPAGGSCRDSASSAFPCSCSRQGNGRRRAGLEQLATLRRRLFRRPAQRRSPARLPSAIAVYAIGGVRR